jgi:tetratricopeptide (TPR) repeat protein
MRPATWLAPLLAVLTAACATAPRRPVAGEDVVFPTVRAGDLAPGDAQRLRDGWDQLLAGRAASAEKTFLGLVERRPQAPPALAALAYARLRLGKLDAAAQGFEAALAREPGYVPALAGAGAIALRRAQLDEALELYRRAVAASPQDPRLRTRLADVKLKLTERSVAAARLAVEHGDVAEAERQYRLALGAAPELTGVRLELAELLVKHDRGTEAAELLAADEQGDRAVLLRLGELREQALDWDGALAAYQPLLARDGQDGEVARRVASVRAARELSQMPEEYRRIFDAPRLTRAELAALVVVKVTALARLPAGQPGVAVDISGSWARDHILRALALGLMSVYPNHTFQPGAIVRRGDLASVVARVLDALQLPAGPAPPLTDMSPNNLFYAGAARVVSAGLMDLTPNGAFEPWRPVSGRDAADVLEGLARLVGP